MAAWVLMGCKERPCVPRYVEDGCMESWREHGMIAHRRYQDRWSSRNIVEQMDGILLDMVDGRELADGLID